MSKRHVSAWTSDRTDPKTGRQRRGAVRGVYWRYGGGSWGFYSQRARKVVPVEGGRERALDAKAKDRLAWSAGIPAPTDTRTTVAQLSAEVLEEKRRELRPSTVRADELGLRYCLREIGQLRITRLTVQRLTQLRADFDAGIVTGRPLAPSSTDRHMSPLRSVLDEAVRRGIIAVNPFSQLKRRRSRSRKRQHEWNPGEVEALLAALADQDEREDARQRYLAPIATMLFTGLRVGEALALHVGDVDLLAGLIHVTHNLDRRSRTLGPTKTDAGLRSVPIPDRLLRILADHIPADANEHNWVFPARHGDLPLSYWNLVNRGLQPALERAGLTGKGITLHSLRHAAASLLIDAGLPVTEVAAHLGHANAAVTTAIYAHRFGDRAEAAARVRNAFDAALQNL